MNLKIILLSIYILFAAVVPTVELERDETVIEVICEDRDQDLGIRG
ncbi:MAG: hypothetical protein JXR88_14415 [Clostridia bacterium]|nr:hypothetical protein [Clostridia bacterium]